MASTLHLPHMLDLISHVLSLLTWCRFTTSVGSLAPSVPMPWVPVVGAFMLLSIPLKSRSFNGPTHGGHRTLPLKDSSNEHVGTHSDGNCLLGRYLSSTRLNSSCISVVHRDCGAGRPLSIPLLVWILISLVNNQPDGVHFRSNTDRVRGRCCHRSWRHFGLR
jgi:hypothetical protein